MGRDWKRTETMFGAAPVPYPTDLPQNLEVWLSRRAVKTPDRGTLGQSALHVLYPQLAHLLNDDAQSVHAAAQAQFCIHSIGGQFIAASCPRNSRRRLTLASIDKLLSYAVGLPRWIFKPHRRRPAWQHGDLARTVQTHGYRDGLSTRLQSRHLMIAGESKFLAITLASI